MLYRFGDFELDADRVALRRGGTDVPIEPQVFALLLLLVENAARMVSRDEIIEKVWHGRIVSESALDSRIKSLRRALGDDGRTQRLVRTVHGQGFHFCAPVETLHGRAPEACADEFAPVGDGRPSIAVVPMALLGEAGPHACIGEAISHDLITALSQLRWLFVIARGTAFRFRSLDVDPAALGRLLHVAYCLTGVVEIFGSRLEVLVDLHDTRSGEIIWAEHFDARLEDVHDLRTRIADSILAVLELRIAAHEADRARINSPDRLDSWSAYHLGLRHLYRFNRRDNDIAAGLFARATALEPGFARAHAGLSSTYFQSAFLNYSGDRKGDMQGARQEAERALELDPLDAFGHFTLGRAFWLSGDPEASLPWLERATSLSPNFAQGFYARAWAAMVCERKSEGIANVGIALAQSPLDPFLYAMLGTRGLLHLIEGDTAQAADWTDRAARSPGAHVMMGMIAMIAQAIHGNEMRARFWANHVRRQRADMGAADFFTSFPFRPGRLRETMARALAANGF